MPASMIERPPVRPPKNRLQPGAADAILGGRNAGHLGPVTKNSVVVHPKPVQRIIDVDVGRRDMGNRHHRPRRQARSVQLMNGN